MSDIFLENSILMRVLCRLCKSEDDKLKLIEFLEALFESPSAIIDKIMSSEFVSSIRFSPIKLSLFNQSISNWTTTETEEKNSLEDKNLLRDQHEVLSYIIKLPHHELFIKSDLLHVIFDKEYGLGKDKKDFINFIKSWRLPSNAYKFIKYNSWLEYRMFMLAIKQPYDNKITLDDVLNDMSTHCCNSWGSLRCNFFGEPEM